MLLETDLKGMFILKQISKENLFSLLSEVTQVIPGYSSGSGLDKGTFPVTQNLLDCNFLSFLTLRHLRTNVIVYRKKTLAAKVFSWSFTLKKHVRKYCFLWKLFTISALH